MLEYHAWSVVKKKLPVFFGNVENVRTAICALIAMLEMNMILTIDSALLLSLEQQGKLKTSLVSFTMNYELLLSTSSETILNFLYRLS